MVPLVLPARADHLPALGNLQKQVSLAEGCLPRPWKGQTEVSRDSLDGTVAVGEAIRPGALRLQLCSEDRAGSLFGVLSFFSLFLFLGFGCVS